MQVFSNRLQELRIEHNLTYLQLAKEIGVDNYSISRWEKGLRIPNIEQLYKIAVYFKVTSDYLIGLEN